MKLIDLIELGEMIRKEIEKDFENVHLTGNLAKTIEVKYDNEKVWVEIPADMYDLGLYLKNKVINFLGKGSYAQEVNKKGGLSKKHSGYVERAISNSIDMWVNKNNIIVKGIRTE